MEEIEEVTVTELIEMYEKGEIQDHIHPLIIGVPIQVAEINN
ncbi:MAG: hypothetical protein U0L53_04870 [Bacteroidales bacterium]|nr:hypothetical protein [Bacteroidales bacterium]